MLALLVAGAGAAPLAAQGTAKQQKLENHVKDQLWPTRPLSAAESDFKGRVVAMRDTIIALQAVVEQADRARRTLHSPAVLLSQSREVGVACSRVERNSVELKRFASGLSTDDQRFGQPAIRRFQSAIDTLHRTSGTCRTSIDRLVAVDPSKVDPDKLLTVFNQIRTAAANYEVAAQGLAKTLDIRIDATDKS